MEATIKNESTTVQTTALERTAEGTGALIKFTAKYLP